MRYLHHCKIGLTALLLANFSSIQAQSLSSNEYSLKAAYLYNLARMVEWPSEVFISTPLNIIMCFYGQDSFGESLDSIAKKSVHERNILIKKEISLEEVKQCHLLFINPSERNKISAILSRLSNLPILTVGDVDEFTQKGGIVNLLKDQDRIRIEINLQKANQVGLKISSRLLAVAKIVN